jgi:hypothetical protein
MKCEVIVTMVVHTFQKPKGKTTAAQTIAARQPIESHASSRPNSRFDALSHSTSFQDVAAYLESSATFAEKLFQGLEQYLQCPHRHIHCCDSQGRERGLREALHLENGFWHMHLELHLDQSIATSPRTKRAFQVCYPPQSLMLPILFKPISPSQFVVQMQGGRERFIINGSQDHDFDTFYEMLFHHIQDHFQRMIDHIAQRSQAPNWIVIEEPFSMLK